MSKANEIATKISTIADDVNGAVGKVATTLAKGPSWSFTLLHVEGLVLIFFSKLDFKLFCSKVFCS